MFDEDHVQVQAGRRGRSPPQRAPLVNQGQAGQGAQQPQNQPAAGAQVAPAAVPPQVPPAAAAAQGAPAAEDDDIDHEE